MLTAKIGLFADGKIAVSSANISSIRVLFEIVLSEVKILDMIDERSLL